MSRATWWTGLACGLVLACGSEDREPGSGGALDGGVTVPVGNGGETLTVTEPAVRAFARERRHASWTREPVTHASAGPHAVVQIYFNDLYLAARRADAYPMSPGAMAVKEIFDDRGERAGFAVAIKTAAGEGAGTWTWWEALGDPLGAGVYGVAAPLCEGCHASAASRDRSMIDRVP